MRKNKKCRYCGAVFTPPGACPNCTLRITRHHNRQSMKLLWILVIIPLLVALYSLITNLQFLSNTTQTYGQVIKVGLESKGSGRQQGLSYTADIEYRDYAGNVRIIYVRPVVLDIQWFHYKEIVPVAYSKDNKHMAQTTKFWFFWSGVWISLLIAGVYAFLLYLAQRWQS